MFLNKYKGDNLADKGLKKTLFELRLKYIAEKIADLRKILENNPAGLKEAIGLLKNKIEQEKKEGLKKNKPIDETKYDTVIEIIESFPK